MLASSFMQGGKLHCEHLLALPAERRKDIVRVSSVATEPATEVGSAGATVAIGVLCLGCCRYCCSLLLHSGSEGEGGAGR